jgi:hypothetical protein
MNPKKPVSAPALAKKKREKQIKTKDGVSTFDFTEIKDLKMRKIASDIAHGKVPENVKNNLLKFLVEIKNKK